MEGLHPETVVERALAFVKEVFGLLSVDRAPEAQANTAYTNAPPDGYRDSDPSEFTAKIIARYNAEIVQRQTGIYR